MDLELDNPPRIRVIKGAKEVLLRQSDLTVQRLSSIFKVSVMSITFSVFIINNFPPLA